MLSVSVYEKYSAGSLYSSVLAENARMQKVLYVAIKVCEVCQVKYFL